MTRRSGRPTVITDKVLSELKMGFSMDCTDKEACIFAGISEKTLYNYQKINPDFLQEKELWKADIILKARIAVAERLEKDAWFALRFLCKKFPHEFQSSGKESFRPSGEISEELRVSLERTDKLLKAHGF